MILQIPDRRFDLFNDTGRIKRKPKCICSKERMQQVLTNKTNNGK